MAHTGGGMVAIDYNIGGFDTTYVDIEKIHFYAGLIESILC
jgi:hypothetical protein